MNTTFITQNPEIKRNAWLELSLQRLVSLPLVLLLIFAIAYFMGSNQVSYDSEGNATVVNRGFDYIYYTSCVLFVILVNFWGAKNASDGIIDEYNSRTWDWQRSHFLSPLEMTVGKLFGSTVYNWYAACWCLLFIGVGFLFSHDTKPPLPYTVMSYVFVAIKTQAVALVLGLLAIHRGDGRGKVRSLLYVPMAIYFLSGLSSGYESLFNSLFTSESKSVLWYYIPFSSNGFYLFSNSFYLMWALLAVYYCFRSEYQYKNTIWPWFLFLISNMVMQCGYFVSWDFIGATHKFLLASFYSMATFAVLTYVSLLITPLNVSGLIQTIQSIKSKNFTTLKYQTPLWAVSLMLTFASVILLVLFLSLFPESLITLSNEHDETLNRSLPIWNEIKDKLNIISLMLLSIPLLLIRDAVLLLFVHTTQKNKRAVGATLIYLAALYIIIPTLLNVSGLDAMIFLFLPLAEYGGFTWLSILLQASVLIYLLKNRLNNQEFQPA